MKQKIINSIAIIVIIVVIAALIIPWPNKLVKDFTGVKYQLGPDNQMYSEEINVRFEGTYKRSYFGLIKDIFAGYITIEGIEINPYEEFRLSIDEERGALISHRYYVKSENRMPTFTYGRLYIDEKFEILTIELYAGEDDNKGFNSYDGFIISAPANSREEAISITKSLVPYSDTIQ